MTGLREKNQDRIGLKVPTARREELEMNRCRKTLIEQKQLKQEEGAIV
jgi:hypothetical protein